MLTRNHGIVSTKILLFVIALGHHFGMVSDLNAQTRPVPPKVAEKIKVVSTAIRENFKKLRQYSVIIDGTYADHNNKKGLLNGNVRYAISANYDKNLFRFDRERPQRIPTGRPGFESYDAGNWEQGSDKKRYLSTPDFNGYASGVSVYPLDLKNGRGMKVVGPIDVKTIGLTWGFIKLTSPNELSVLEHAVKNFETTPFQSFAESDRGRILSLKITSDFSSTEYRFDAQSGDMPVRVDVKVYNRPAFHSETTWKNHKGLWLVETTRFATYDLSTNDSSEYTEYNLTFNWRNLNKPLDPDLFKVKNLGIHKYQRFVDTSGEKPVTVKRVYPPGAQP